MTYDQLMALASAERKRRAGTPQTVWEGTGDAAFQRTLQAGDAGFIDYNDPNSAIEFSVNNQTGNAGMSAAFDPATGRFRLAQGDATSGIQRWDVGADGTVDLGFEDIDRNAKFNRGVGTLAAIAALGSAAAYAGGLMGGTTALTGSAGGATAAAGTAGAAGAGSLLTPANAQIAATIAGGAMAMQQGREQAGAIRDATAANERIAAEQASAAEQARRAAERARQEALAAGGSQGSRMPDLSSARARNRAGAGSTMLTGPGGVSTGSLSLGAPTLLGRLA